MPDDAPTEPSSPPPPPNDALSDSSSASPVSSPALSTLSPTLADLSPAPAEPPPQSLPEQPSQSSTRPRRYDPWAHRRGEPRLFAFLWSLFLFAATLTTFGSASASGELSHETLRPAARTLLVLIAVGISIGWPLVRLSQSPDRHPRRGSLRDAIVILVPIHAVLWPQMLWWLAQWPISVVAALVALFTAWTMLIAALLAYAQITRPAASSVSPRANAHATNWMLIFIALTLLGLVPALIDSSRLARAGDVIPRAANLSWMPSPITGAWDLARDRSWTGNAASVSRLHWLAIGVVSLIAGVVWALALVRRPRKPSRPARPHASGPTPDGGVPFADTSAPL
jgi:hypothetical protein